MKEIRNDEVLELEELQELEIVEGDVPEDDDSLGKMLIYGAGIATAIVVPKVFNFAKRKYREWKIKKMMEEFSERRTDEEKEIIETLKDTIEEVKENSEKA